MVMASGVEHPGMSKVKLVDVGAGVVATVPLTVGPCQKPDGPPACRNAGSEGLPCGATTLFEVRPESDEKEECPSPLPELWAEAMPLEPTTTPITRAPENRLPVAILFQLDIDLLCDTVGAPLAGGTFTHYMGGRRQALPIFRPEIEALWRWADIVVTPVGAERCSGRCHG